MLISGSGGFFALIFGCGASKGVVGTLRRMSGSRPGTVAVFGALNVAELAPKNEPSR